MATTLTPQELLELAQDYNSRVLVLGLIILVNLFIFFFSHKFKDDYDWQKLRNFFLKIFSFAIIALMVLFVPLFLADGYTLENMIELVIGFYKIAFALTGLIVFIWFKDFIFEMLSKLVSSMNPRRNYIFGRNRR